MITLTKKEEKMHNKQKVCFICNKELVLIMAVVVIGL